MKRKIAVMTGGWDVEVLYQIVKGIQCRAAQEAADVFIFNCYGSITKDTAYNKGENNIFNLPDFDDFDGFLLTSANLDSIAVRNDLRERFLASGKPAVNIEHKVEGLHYVGVDNYEAMYKIVEHLVRVHNCRSFNYIGGPSDNYENIERKRAFCDVLKKYNIPVEPKRMKDYNFLYEDGAKAFRYFQANHMECPDAVVSANDEMAIGYNVEATRHGLSAPCDFLITGFDNFEFAGIYAPRLTTIDREKEGAGYISCDVLLRLINGEEVPHTTRLWHKEVFSESCGCSTKFTNSIKMKVQQGVNKSLLNGALDLQLNRFETGLVSSDDFTIFNHYLAEYLQKIDCDSFYLLLNQESEELSSRDDRKPSDIGYSDTMNIKFAWETGKLVDYSKVIFPAVNLVPGYKEEDEKSHLYLFSPLHLKEKNFGYCVMKDGLELLENRLLFRWLNIISISLEVIFNKQDILKLNDQLKILYMQDFLTGVYNRYGYEQLAANAFRLQVKKDIPSLVMFIDINELKYINDTFGHEHGDLAICTVANSVKRFFSEEAIIIRYGGDEFIVISACESEEAVKRIIHDMKKDLERTNQMTLVPYDISVSIGYVIAEGQDEMTLDDCIKEADRIMYENKKKFYENKK